MQDGRTAVGTDRDGQRGCRKAFRCAYAGGELPSAQEAADFYQAEVFKDMAELRLAVDEMETLTARACWPYPSYGDLLFSVR